MRTVYKYPLNAAPVGDNHIIPVELPVNAQVLDVRDQGGQICLWALINPYEHEKEIREIAVIGTGWHIDNGVLARHISTFQQAGGALVWHAFEVV